jgi:DNA polymerase III alpha subunit (gram-positive type)
MKYELYVTDVETTGLTPDHDVIEVSFYRMSTSDQKTWCIKPIRIDNIQPDALRVNGHNLENLLHNTKEGRETYIPAEKATAEIENWLMNDLHTSEERLLVGHNICGFDKDMLIATWNKVNANETFPFSKRYALDTMQIQIFMDVIGITEQSEYYNLNGLVQKYGIKKEKAHRASADVRMTKDLFLKQANLIRNLAKK